MIYSRFDKILIGDHYLSQILGMQEIKAGHSVLILDDGSEVSHRWSRHWSLLEKNFFQDLGRELKIPELIGIDSYLEPISLILCLNDTFIEISNSPFSNLRELARKMPFSFTKEFIYALDKLNPEVFDNEIFELILDLSRFGRSRGFQYMKDFKGPEWKKYPELTKIFEHFLTSIGQNPSPLSEQLYFVLKVLYQSAFDHSFSFGEGVYLFSKLISPAYYLDSSRLHADLKQRFVKFGGVIEKSTIDHFSFRKNSLQGILLTSYLGLMQGGEALVMGHLKKDYPFNLSPYRSFKSISFELDFKHPFLEFLKNKLVIFSEHQRMGTDFPFLDFFFDGEKLRGLFAFGESNGARDIFYYEAVKNDLYNSLIKIFPGVIKEDIVKNLKLSPGQDVWVDLTESSLLKLSSAKRGLTLFEKESMRPLEHISYHGPLKNQHFGLHAYLSQLFG